MNLMTFLSVFMASCLASAGTNLQCRSKSGPPATFSATLEGNQGTLLLRTKDAESVKSIPLSLSLRGSRTLNYHYSNRASYNQEQYTLAIRGYLLIDKISGVTEDVTLETRPAGRNYTFGQSFVCQISHY